MTFQEELRDTIENVLRDKTEFFLHFQGKEADCIIHTLIQPITALVKKIIGDDIPIPKEEIEIIGKKETSMKVAMKIAQDLQRKIGYNQRGQALLKKLEES
jgi:hypothetical protein